MTKHQVPLMSTRFFARCYYRDMTAVVLILTAGIILLSVSQVFTVFFFLKKLEIVPEAQSKPKIEDVNDFGDDKYVDLSEITPEMGIKSLIQK